MALCPLSFAGWVLCWACSCVVWFIFQHYYRKYINYPPAALLFLILILVGPVPWPVIGNLFQVKRHVYVSFQEWAQYYGSKLMTVRLGPQKCIIVNDPKTARELFSDYTFSGRPQCYFTQVLSGGSYGILMAEGTPWEEQRRFTLRHLRDLGFAKTTMQTLIMESAQEMLEWMLTENGQPISHTQLQRRLSLATLSSLWILVAGKRMSQDDPKLTGLLDALQESGAAITKHPLLVVAPWIRHILPGISGYRKFQQVVDKMRGFIWDTIQEHKDDVLEEDDEHSSRDFIEAYLNKIRWSKDNSSSFHRLEGVRNLMAVASDLFQGGSETTGITLTWAILFLMTHPDEQKKLQNEIDTVVGPSRLPQLHDRLKMPYTEAVILETTRLSSVVPLGVFHSALIDTHYHNYFIQKGTWIWTNLYAIHMDSHVWGNPEEFKPERFLCKNGVSVVKSHHEYHLPFSVGKRECPGKSLANDTLFLFITSLFQRFTASPAPGCRIPNLLDSDDSFFRAPKPFSAVLQKRATVINTPVTITFT